MVDMVRYVTKNHTGVAIPISPIVLRVIMCSTVLVSPDKVEVERRLPCLIEQYYEDRCGLWQEA